MTNMSTFGGLCAATLAASLLLAAAAACGGNPDLSAGSQAVVGSESRPTSAIATDGGERRARADSGSAAAVGDTGLSTNPNATAAPAAPALRLTVAGGQLRLSWDASSAAAYYKLFANADGASGFTRVGSDFPADRTGAALDIVAHRHDWDRARYLLEACNVAGCTASNPVTTFGLRPQVTARARFTRPATAPAPAAVEAGGAGASLRFVRPTSEPALAAPSHRAAAAAPGSVRACARCLAQ